MTIRYRVQNPAGIIGGAKRKVSKTVSAVGRVGSPVTRACLSAVDRTTPDSAVDVHVERVSGTATRSIHEVYAATRPGDLHVPRTESFLDWRSANPRWDTTSYIATQDDRPVATVVVRAETVDGTRIAQLLDVQPMTTQPGRSGDVSALLETVLRDYSDVDLITAPPAPYPGLFRRHSFFRNDGLLLSRFSTATAHVVRTHPDPDDTIVLGRDAADQSN